MSRRNPAVKRSPSPSLRRSAFKAVVGGPMAPPLYLPPSAKRSKEDASNLLLFADVCSIHGCAESKSGVTDSKSDVTESESSVDVLASSFDLEKLDWKMLDEFDETLKGLSEPDGLGDLDPSMFDVEPLVVPPDYHGMEPWSFGVPSTPDAFDVLLNGPSYNHMDGYTARPTKKDIKWIFG